MRWWVAVLVGWVSLVAGCGSGSEVPESAPSTAPSNTAPSNTTLPTTVVSAAQGIAPTIPTTSDDPRDRFPGLGSGRWREYPSPLGPVASPILVRDGSQVLEIGGLRAGRPQRAGAAFDPATGRWRILPEVPSGVGLQGAVGVRTGRRVLVYGSHPPGSEPAGCCVAGLFDPATSSWSITPPAPLTPPSAQRDVMALAAAEVARGALVAQLLGGTSPRLELARYDVAGGSWTRVDPPLPPAHRPLALALVDMDGSALLWSMWGSAASGSSGVDLYRLGRDGSWTDLTRSWPQHETVPGALFIGRAIIVPPGQIWCGACPHPAPHDTNGWLVDPVTLLRAPLPHGPADDLGPSFTWTGATLLAVNASGSMTGGSVQVDPGDLAVLGPAGRSWTTLPRAPATLQSVPAPLWAAHRLIAVGTGELLTFGAGEP